MNKFNKTLKNAYEDWLETAGADEEAYAETHADALEEWLNDIELEEIKESGAFDDDDEDLYEDDEDYIPRDCLNADFYCLKADNMVALY